MIESIDDREAYRRRVHLCWEENSSYWLSNPLRHVTDVGEYIVENVIKICSEAQSSRPTIVDMGFGSAWLYTALRGRNFSCNYVGFDSNEIFVTHSRTKFADDKSCRFELVDLEEPIDIDVKADLVVNAFNFFELSDLQQPMKNAYDLLLPKGKLLISTIDCTYLILAISKSWPDFLNNLARYNKLPGVKYTFQPIDLGDGASSTLQYPSVLYSRDDFLAAAEKVGFHYESYKEGTFTCKTIPKIYFHLKLVKGDSSALSI